MFTHRSSSRLIVITSILIVIAAITVNALAGSGHALTDSFAALFGYTPTKLNSAQTEPASAPAMALVPFDTRTVCNSGSPDFASVALAVADANAAVPAGGRTYLVCAGLTETAPAGGYVITATGASAANPVVFMKSGGGANPTITASAGLTAGALNDAIFKIVGADYITIDGFTMLENAANTTTAAATNNMTEWGVAILYASATDGAQNATVKNCTIDLDRTYANTFGIYSNSTHSAADVITTATATGATGGNHNSTFTGNNITDVNQGIVVVGPTAAADQNDGLTIGGTAPNANTITNYGTTGTFSLYANITTSAVAGILVRNTKNYNVSFNSVTSSSGASGLTAGTLRGIVIPAASIQPTGTFTNNVNSNTLALTSNVLAGTINGISVESGTSSPTSTNNINSNNFTTLNHSIAAATGSITAILHSGTATAGPLVASVSNNTFTNLTSSSTGSFTFISSSYTAPTNATKNVNGNSVVTGFNKTGAGGTITFFTDNGSSTGGTISNANNNTFSNITANGGATGVTGISSTDGITTSPTKTVMGNIVSNINTNGGTGTVTAITVNFDVNTALVSSNTVSNITHAGAINGILIGSSGAGTVTTTQNIVHTLTGTGTSAVTGISVGGATNSTKNVSKNKIYNLENNNAAGATNGILLSSGTTLNVFNNLVGDIRTPAVSAANALNGINITSATATSNVNVSFNTVYLNASSTGANFGSSALFATTSATATTATLNLRDNILVNNSTPAGTGLTAAYRRSSTTLTNFGSASNNNDFYAGTPSATSVIFYDGTNSDQTIGSYKARVAPADSASITENPAFLSTTGSSASFLHINTAMITGLDHGGIPVSGITDDFDGNTRDAGTPDIGADEFVGPGPTPTATQTFTPTNTATPTGTATNTATPTPTCANFNSIFSENFDSVTAPTLPAGWTASNASGTDPGLWITSAAGTPTPVADTAPNSAFVNEPTSVSDKLLDSPSIPIPASGAAQLSFRNNYALEASAPNYYDGGVLEMSVNAGPFTDILAAGGSFVTGGYVGTISTGFSSPLAGRQAWSGSSGGFITTVVDLPPSTAGQVVVFRWRMASDSSATSAGWRIDNVNLGICGATPTASPTPTNTFTPTSTGTATNTATASPSPTNTFTPTNTATPTNTPTASPSPTFTATPTAACTPSHYANAATITIPAGAPTTTQGAADPYPSNIVVSGLSGNVYTVTVKLNGLSHTFPDDIDIMLVGPGGQNAVIMSDVGSLDDVTNITLTLDDNASIPLPDGTPLPSGTYRPANYDTTTDAFPAPAPAPAATPASGLLLQTFIGSNPNGTWSLYVFDDANLDSGSIAGGWELNITTDGVCATPTATATATSTNTPTATATATPSATFTPGGASISGTITYGNAILNPPPPRFVRNVSVASTAGSPAVGPVITGTPGTYTLTGFGAGSYTIAPSKPGGPNTAITSNDAARVAQAVAGSVPFVTMNQKFAADATGNGAVSSQDAAKIAQYVAGLPLSPPNLSGVWKFFTGNFPQPPASPIPTPPYQSSRTYASVTSNLTGEDYIALLIGEASGNYNPATAARPAAGPERMTAVTAPRLVTPADNEVVIPVSVQGVANKGVISYEFDLRYDPSVIQPQAEPVEVAGTVSRALSAVANPNEPGLLRVVMYGAYPIESNGLLLNLRFTAVGAPGSVSPLTFERIMFNEGDPGTVATDGQVELSAAAADQAEISGRLLNTMGQGIPNARVTLTDTAGQARSVMSSGFGVYRFGGLQVGQTYTITVDSQRNAFTPLTVSVTDQVVNVDMIAKQ